MPLLVGFLRHQRAGGAEFGRLLGKMGTDLVDESRYLPRSISEGPVIDSTSSDSDREHRLFGVCLEISRKTWSWQSRVQSRVPIEGQTD
jgi:hypothetical protein